MKKKLSKTLWYGTDVDSNGNPIIPHFTSDPNDLLGLHVGELYIHFNAGKATLWTANESGSIVSIVDGGNIDLSEYLLVSDFNRLWEIRTDSNGTDYIFGKLPVVTQYGITMYADYGSVNIPTIAEGLPFDNRTIWFNPTTKQIEVIGGTGGGGGEGVSNFWDLSGIPSWITNTKPTYDYSEIEGAPDLSKYALVSQIPSLDGYATESWVTNKGYATQSWVLGKGYATPSDIDTRIDALINGAPAAFDTLKEIADVLQGNVNSIGDIITTLGTKADKATTLSGYGITDAYTKSSVNDLLKGYVTIAGTEDVTGLHDFVNGLKVGGIKLYKSQDDVIYIDGNLAVRGAVTMYADDGSLNVGTIYDGLPIDGTTIYWETTDSGKVLKAKVGTEGGITDVNYDMVIAALGFVPYDSTNPNGYITSSALSGYATQTWVKNQGYLTEHQDLSGYQPLITTSNKLPYSLISGTPTIPTSLKNPYALTFGSKTYDGSEAKTITASDLGALTAHQTIYNLTMQAGAFTAVTFDPNGAAKTVNIPTTTSHISEGSNLYFTNARATGAITGGASTIATSNLTASRALISNSSGKVAVSAVTSTELGYLDGVTSAIQTQLNARVTLSGTQTITGEKNFTGGLKVNGSPIVYDATNKYWKLEGDLIVTGGVTMFASDTSFTPSTIMDAITVDGTTISKSGGVLKVIGGGSGITDITKEMVIGALGYTPYNATNPNGYITSYVDTKNTAGSTNSSSKLFLIGATSQAANPQTYSHDTAYVGTDGCLYSGGSKVLTSHQSIYALTIKNSAGTTQLTYTPNSGAGSITLTKAMVGLGNVENTALSTWTGTSKITTLGTITTGTWNGTKIANSYLANSSISISGTSVSLGGSITQAALRTALGLGSNAYTSTAYLPSSSYTAADVLAKLKTVDGSGSGLDADLLDGIELNSVGKYILSNQSYRRLASGTDLNNVEPGFWSTLDNTSYTNAPIQNFGLMCLTLNTGYRGQLMFPYAHKGLLRYRTEAYYASGKAWGDWNEIAYTHSNVASATKLATARTIWGQSFDGTGNIDSNLVLRNNFGILNEDTNGTRRNSLFMSDSNNLHIGYGISSAGYNTYIDGNNIYFRTGTSHTTMLTLKGTGAIFNGTLNMPNNNGILWGDTATTYRNTLYLSSNNNLRLGYGTSAAGYNTYIDGNQISLTYGTSHTVGLELLSSGRISAKGNIDIPNNKAIYFKNSSATDINSLYFDNSNILHLGYGTSGSYYTKIYGNQVYLHYGSRTLGLLLNASGNVTIGSSDSASTTYKMYVSGKLATTDDIFLRTNAKYLRGVLADGTETNLIGVNANNSFLIGYGQRLLGTTTYYYGGLHAWYYGTAGNSSIGMRLNDSGNVTIGASDLAGTSSKLHVDGIIKTSGSIICQSTSNVVRRVGVANDVGEVSLYVAQSGNRGLYDNTNSRWVLYTNGDTSLNGNAIYFRYGTSNTAGMYLSSSGNVGIGTTSPSSKLHVAGNIFVTGGITMQSARKLKNIQDERGLSLEELRAIKPTRFTWKDGRDNKIHIGGIADDVMKVLPEVIYKTTDDTLTMDYGNAAFAISASLIKPVINHEERIKMLEEENKRLKEEIEILKCNIA